MLQKKVKLISSLALAVLFLHGCYAGQENLPVRIFRYSDTKAQRMQEQVQEKMFGAANEALHNLRSSSFVAFAHYQGIWGIMSMPR